MEKGIDEISLDKGLSDSERWLAVKNSIGKMCIKSRRIAAKTSVVSYPF